MSLDVLDAGWGCKLVDDGRPHARSLGVPVGGAADRLSFHLGNALVGNEPNAPALEICLKGPTLRATEDTGMVLLGAPFQLTVTGRTLCPGQSFTLRRGEELYIGGTPQGFRAYLCVRGGFDGATVLKSRSALEAMQIGKPLLCPASTIRPRSVPAELYASWETAAAIRFLPGLQADWFQSSEFVDREFTISPASNRMGLRFESTPLTMPTRELVSEPVCPGSVQVTRDGQCILLGVDGQTIGGYPKIAQVIAADLDRVGQLRPGSRIRFKRVTFDEAAAAFEERRRLLAEWQTRLRLSLDAF